MIEFFEGIISNPWVLIFIISMIPFIELRGAVIVGTAMNLPVVPMFITCLLGNLLPLPFVILFGRKILDFLGETKLFGRAVKGYKRRLDKKAASIRKYGPIALIAFVGIPIPGTGAWGGAVASVLLNLRISRAVPCIMIGLIIAYLIMTVGAELLFGVIGSL